ncbi:MAG: hypothetical protein IGQ88_10900 [Gloeomargaritaceae cyanobacterium C42_A2020_066]|nr:hypothetical protein [Gloeomargaritaceae cyanobacterium C42_A2020_066]
MPRVANEYAVYIMLEGGHREEVRFPTIQDFQKWYQNDLMSRLTSDEMVNVPIKNVQGEFLVIRPSKVVGIRVEPIFLSSLERF